MASVHFELAGPGDNRQLLALQAANVMPGFLRVAYERGPDFFAALEVEGCFRQTIVGRDAKSGEIVGFGNRSLKPLFVNGEQRDIGYLSGLRTYGVGAFPVLGAYRFLGQLHNDQRAPFYLSTIVDGNRRAQRLLTSGRRGLPVYHPFGQLFCKALSPAVASRLPESASIGCRPAEPGDLDRILAFLGEQGQKKQFFPCYGQDDFFKTGGLLRGLEAGDMALAEGRCGRLLGLAAAWNQQPFRASRLVSYPAWLAGARPLVNLWHQLRRLPLVPPAGSRLDFFFLSLVAVQDDDQAVFSALLRQLLAASKRKFAFLMAGFHGSHPFRQVLQRLPGHDYRSTVYLVHWPDGARAVKEVDGRPVYLELGAL